VLTLNDRLRQLQVAITDFDINIAGDLRQLKTRAIHTISDLPVSAELRIEVIRKINGTDEEAEPFKDSNLAQAMFVTGAILGLIEICRKNETGEPAQVVDIQERV